MKRTFIIAFFAFVLLSAGAGPADAALTQSQISAIIGLLRSFGADESVVANVHSALTRTGTSDSVAPVPPSAISYCPALRNTLYRGSSDAWTKGEVSMLQQFLRQYYPDLPVTGYFGVLTEEAVIRFQTEHGISPIGVVGPETSKKIASLCASVGSPVDPLPPQQSGRLEISPSSPALKVGESIYLKAMYQPPMPPCPAGAYCAPPALTPVVAEWTSSNPSVASIGSDTASCLAVGCPVITSVTVKGVSNGTAEIKAVYKVPSSGAVLTATTKVTVSSGSVIPSITVLSPNGGENYLIGMTAYNFAHWRGPANQGYLVEILSLDKVTQWAIAYSYGGTPSADYYMNWLVGRAVDSSGQTVNLPTGQYYLRVSTTVSGTSISDQSDAPFTLIAPPPVSPTYTKLSVPTNTLTNGVQVIYRFKATAPSSADATITSLEFSMVPSGIMTVRDVSLYAYSDSGFSSQAYGINPIAGKTGDAVAVGGVIRFSSNEFPLGIPLTIPAGASRYFELRSTVTNVVGPASLTTSFSGLASEVLTNISVSATPVGYIGPVSSTAISGWACVPGLSDPLKVRVSIAPGNYQISNITANIARTESGFLQNSGCNDIYHGFNVNPSLSFPALPAGTYTVSATAQHPITGVVANLTPLSGQTTFTVGGVVTQPAPVLSSVTPSSVTALQTTTFTITGSYFQSGATIVYSGPSSGTLPSTFVSSSQLSVTVSGGLLQGTYTFKVRNPDGKESGTLSVVATTPAAPAPILSSVTPSSVNALQTTTFIIYGSYFQSGATIVYSGPSSGTLPSTFVSSSQLSVTVSGGLLQGTYTFKVRNPDGKESGTLTVIATAPAVSADAPQNLSYSGGACVSGRHDYVTLRWQNPTTVSSVNTILVMLERALGNGSFVNFANQGALSGGGFITEYTDGGSTSYGDSLTYRVRYMRSDGTYSGYSNTVTVLSCATVQSPEGDYQSFAAALLSLERQLEELRRILSSLLP